MIKATDLKKERDDAREERDTLRAARMTPAQLDDTKASEIARAVEEAIEPLDITIGTLEVTVAGLRSDERMERSREAVEAIQELEKLKSKYRTLSEDLITERNARDQDRISRMGFEKHLEEQISWLRYRLDGEEAASAVLRDLIAQQPNGNENYKALETQLAEAQERISQLESTNSQYRDLSKMLQNVEKF